MPRLLCRTSWAASTWTTCLVLLALPAAASAQVSFQRIYVSSDPAPGAADGALFSGFAYPVISPSGSIAFTAFLKATPASVVDLTTGQAIFGPTASGTSLIGRSAQPAIGLEDGAVNDSFHSPVLSDMGLLYRTLLRTGSGASVTTANDNALHIATPAGVQLIAREAGPSPGIVGGLVISQYTAPPLLMNHAGQIAFEAFLAPGGVPAVTGANDNIMLAPTPAGLGIVAREDFTAPGTPDSAEFNTFENPVLNHAGHVAFNATLRTGVGGAPVGFGNDAAIFGPTPFGPGPVAREGNLAPGASDGARYGFLGKPSLNAAGQVAFYSILNGVPSSTGRAVFGPTPGGLGLVARGGQTAPGADGDVYNDFSLTVLVNEAGGVAFKSQLRAADGTAVTDADAIFGPRPTGLGLIAREDQPAPGVSDDALFGNLTDTMAMNRWGDLVFDAPLRDGPSNSVTAANDRGIFAYSHVSDSVLLIAREGDLFDLGEGDYLGPRFRTIQSWELVTGSGGGDGLAASLNDPGQLVFELNFTDMSSALVIAQLPTAIPEPATVLLLLAAALLWSACGSRLLGRWLRRRLISTG